MFGWGEKGKKHAEIVTHVQDVKEQSNVKLQNVHSSSTENIVCAEQIIDSLKPKFTIIIAHNRSPKS